MSNMFCTYDSEKNCIPKDEWQLKLVEITTLDLKDKLNLCYASFLLYKFDKYVINNSLRNLMQN